MCTGTKNLYPLWIAIFTITRRIAVWYTYLKHARIYAIASIKYYFDITALWIKFKLTHITVFIHQSSPSRVLPCSECQQPLCNEIFPENLVIKLTLSLGVSCFMVDSFQRLFLCFYSSKHTNSEPQECLMQLLASMLHILWAPLFQHNSTRTPCFLKLHKSTITTLPV